MTKQTLTSKNRIITMSLSVSMKNIPAILLLVAIFLSGKSAFAQVEKESTEEVSDSENAITRESENAENSSFVNDEEFHNNESKAEEIHSTEVDDNNIKIINQEYTETSDSISGSGTISGSHYGVDDKPSPGNDPLD